MALECADLSCSLYPSTIPKGLRLAAPGCEERATLGPTPKHPPTPKGLRPCPLFRSHGAATLSGLYSLSRFPQGSSFLATLGFVSESLWDSAVPSTSGDACKEQDLSALSSPGDLSPGNGECHLWLPRAHSKIAAGTAPPYVVGYEVLKRSPSRVTRCWRSTATSRLPKAVTSHRTPNRPYPY